MNKKWKDKLLSSGIPLELEVGRILVEKDLCVDFDYSYKRHDEGEEKEFSVDIRASRFNPFQITNSRDTIVDIDLMVECKYRNPSINWLFIPEINTDGFENFSDKGAVKVFDEFSETNSRFKSRCDPFAEICLKGIEINLQTGDCYDNGIRHGINQLLYSLPHVMYERINASFYGHINDVNPFVISPILITTADLRILKDDFSMNNLQNSEELDDISEIVPYLKLHSETTPSFDIHCSNIFEDIPLEQNKERFNHFKNLRQREVDLFDREIVEKSYTSPSKLLTQLRNGLLTGLFNQTIICNINAFPDLLKEMKVQLEILIEGFEQIPEKKEQ